MYLPTQKSFSGHTIPTASSTSTSNNTSIPTEHTQFCGLQGDRPGLFPLVVLDKIKWPLLVRTIRKTEQGFYLNIVKGIKDPSKTVKIASQDGGKEGSREEHHSFGLFSLVA